MKRLLTILSLVFLLFGISSLAYADSSEYEQAQSIENGYYLSKNGHELEFIFGSGANGNLYADGSIVERDVLWNFFSNGQNVYYTKNDCIYKYDLNTHNKILIVSETKFPFIEGIYNDKYLYYSSMKYSNKTQSLSDLIIYDIENNREVSYIKDVGIFELSKNYIFVEPCSGDLAPLDIRQFNLDGSNEKTIANDASSMKVIDDILYYSAIELIYSGEYNVKSQVKSYDATTGITSELTDVYEHTITIDFTPTYAVFQNIKTMEKHNIYYKPKEISILLNGQKVEFDQSPINTPEGRVLVPIRKIAESMNKIVLWSDETKTAFIDNSDNGLIIPLYEMQMYIADENGFSQWQCVPLDVPAMEINGRTLVPVRAFCESLGANVRWVDEEKTAYITYNDAVTKDHMNDMLFDSICLTYYIEKVAENPFTEYSVSIDDFYNNRTEWIDLVTMGLSDPFSGIEDLMSNNTNAENVIKMTLSEIIKEIPCGKASDYDAGILQLLKDAIASGVDIYSDVGGLGSTIRNYSSVYKTLDDVLLDYSKNYHSKVSGIFDWSVFTVEELAYILTDYKRNVEYINAFENGLRDSGMLNTATENAIDLLRTEYTNKFIGVALDLRDECLEYGTITSLSVALGSGVGVGKLAWDVLFGITGVNSQGEDLKVFYGIYCIDNALNKAVYNKMTYDKPNTASEISEFRSLWEMTRAEKITGYKAMRGITNWYNKDSIEYANKQIENLSAITYRLFK